MKRRQIIPIAATSLISFCGCTSNQNDSPEVGLGRITITNMRQSDVEVRFTIEKDGNTVYDRSHHVSANINGSAGGVEIVESWMGEKTHYKVTVSIVGSDIQKSFSTEDAEEFISDWGDHDCFILSGSLETDDVYFALGAMDSCPS